VDTEKAKEWLAKGAQPTKQVKNLLRISGVL
jgi:ribosomal protein S16